MELFVNQPFIDKRVKYGKWANTAAIVALIGGIMLMNRSLVGSYAVLLVGIAGATLGSYFSSRYMRDPRPDQELSAALEGLDKRYSVYHYYLPSSHVVASHHGLTVVIPRGQRGQVIYNEKGRWQHKAGIRKLRQMFGEAGLGKPDQDVANDMGWVKEWIDEIFPEDDIPVNGVIAFTNDSVELHADDSPIPAVKSADLTQFMKQGLKGQPTLSTAKQKELRRVLDELIVEEE
jgi:hypothetical protein